jgi:hypothetical protein
MKGDRVDFVESLKQLTFSLSNVLTCQPPNLPVLVLTKRALSAEPSFNPCLNERALRQEFPQVGLDAFLALVCGLVAAVAFDNERSLD